MPRPVSVTVLILLALGLFALMWWGWRKQVRRTGAGLSPATAPLTLPPSLTVAGVYVSSTAAGEWLGRIAADGLGVRSPVQVSVAPDGVTMARTGAPDVVIPAADLRGARRERGIAGKVRDPGGLVVIRWRNGDVDLDTGIRPRYRADLDALVAAINDITPALADAAQTKDDA